jgi:hypothetical protein
MQLNAKSVTVKAGQAIPSTLGKLCGRHPRLVTDLVKA